MIAQVVFDLPVDSSFDYLIPPTLENHVQTGARVQALFGPKKRTGVVVGFLELSAFKDLKPLKALLDEKPLLDPAQLELGVEFSRYYGCSLGEALFTMVRTQVQASGKKVEAVPALRSRSRPSEVSPGPTENAHLSLIKVPSGNYQASLISLLKPLAERGQRALILAPDQFIGQSIQSMLKGQIAQEHVVLGARSLVFRSLADISLVIMVDEENPSYKQEQSPMYDTRQVLLMRARREGLRVVFLSTAPSVELFYAPVRREMAYFEADGGAVKSQVVDLNNYKILTKGILSPAVLSAVDSHLGKKMTAMLVFNHRGSFAMTRCQGCEFVLKCHRCESPVVYSRSQKQYLCRYCTFHLPADTVCPKCKKLDWKSFGLGVEQLHKILQDRWPTARVQGFERGMPEDLKPWDILIGTVALLRFKTQIKPDLVVLLDIDSELNRMDMRSCFRAWSMVSHFRAMARHQLLIQSRQIDHYVLQALVQDKPEIFYQEDLKIRKELGFSPFGHHVLIGLRSALQKSVDQGAQELYEALVPLVGKDVQLHTPAVEMIAKKRGQHRLNILLQGENVVDMMSSIKTAMASIKRRAKVIITFNVDP